MAGFTAAILAGGKSSRMGTDKAFVELGGIPVIDHVLARITQAAPNETILISNKSEQYAGLGLPIYNDILPDKAALGGIYTALTYSRYPYTLIVACDMPFVSLELLRYMVQLADGDQFDVIVPRVDGFPQGTHAIYSKACREFIQSQLNTGRLNIIGFYPQVRVRYLDEPEYKHLDPQGLSFFNMNTPEELEEAQQILKKAVGNDGA